jgi:tol-pal system protein YbgF
MRARAGRHGAPRLRRAFYSRVELGAMMFRSSSLDGLSIARNKQGQRSLPLVAWALLCLAAAAAGEPLPVRPDRVEASRQIVPAHVTQPPNGRVERADAVRKFQDDSVYPLAQAQEQQGSSVRQVAQAEQNPPNRGVVQLLNQVEALNGEVSRLRGQIEVLANDINNAQKRQRDMYVDLDTRLRRIEQTNASRKDQETIAAFEERIRRLEQGTAPASIPQPVVAATVAAPATPSPPASTNAPTPVATSASPAAATASVSNATATSGAASSLPPASLTATDQAAIQRVYDNAYSNYRNGDYTAAIRGFETFLKTYSKHALAANAQYWIGESYFHMRDYRAAIEAERRLLGTFPESAKSADALLIIGTAESNLGDTTAARKTLEELIAKYPSSESADKAKGRLAKLK